MKGIFTRLNLIVGLSALVLLTLCVFPPPAVTVLATSTNPTAAQEPKSDPDRPLILSSLPNAEAGRNVGTCNTAGACAALKVACKSIKNHSFKTTAADGSLGMCVDQTSGPQSATWYLRNSNAPNPSRKSPVADVGLVAPKKSSEATLYCHGAVMCRKVKNVCPALGGTYTPVYDLSGACRSPRHPETAGFFSEAVGTGDLHAAPIARKRIAETPAQNSSDSFYGTGVYKSTDGGRTWQVVGTCNTASGCVALKDACNSLKGHSFKATGADGSLGMCSNATFYLRNSDSAGSGNKQPPTKPTADLSLAAPKKTSEATLNCHGAVFCKKVKNICAALGGTYTPVYDLSGSCRY